MKDLRNFLDDLEKSSPNEFCRIRDQVNPEYEVTAYWQLLKERGNPVLFFENVVGTNFSLVANVFGSRNRIARAVGCAENKFFETWAERTSKPLDPTIVSQGPVQDIQKSGSDIDLTKFPIPRHFAEDGGRYVTSGIVCAKDPDSGLTNLSYARLQLKGPRNFGISMHSHGNLWSFHQKAKKKGQGLEVAVIIGAHPAFYVAAGARIIDEYRLIGGLLQQPVELMKCETVNLEVPASAEIVIEGVIRTDVEEDEGPFTEFTGYLTGRSTRNIMEVTAVSHRSDAIYLNIIPSNSAEHVLLGGVAKQAEIYRKVKAAFPQVKAISWPTWGSHFVAVMSLKNEPPGISDQAAHFLMGLDYYIKILIMVDEDVDVQSESEYLWAVATRSQPESAVHIIRKSLGHILDPSTKGEGVTSKMVIDATIPRDWTSKRPTLPAKIFEKVEQKLHMQ
jgi:2,5-furandicarboxylate decarboxylase 1